MKSYTDLRLKCYKLGMEPLEIKNDKMLNIIYYLLKILDFDLTSNNLFPFAYDYNCDVSKCSNIFKPLNDINTGDITEIINNFIAEKGNGISDLFTTLSDGEMSVKNIAAFGKVDNIVFESLVQILLEL